ncbi:MAG: prepilin-type N-terminal cleavage/methylation domain-containing protein [Dethiobacter sp.]|nr:prepilin-type N-terminal cleavage/methylation domain-containing protein [Dethiobacter sp.]MBS3901990.1 prepilin-type N-terminal cleavage/methylation domain-containing protein [Dethiobacter sp.]MBS3988374.1 prepilin-type N-terminal cleavage/methylation domain-containing protein [Dethiobacter sp.]
MKLQNWKNDVSGLSLVEVLVALLVMAIVIVPLISMFTNGFSGIARTGRKSQDLYQAQKEVEAAIYAGVNSITPSPPPLRITFADDSFVLVPGEIREVRVNDIAITTFILNRAN